jgi:glycosyltransferase involved in cell wall biosynthesis
VKKVVGIIPGLEVGGAERSLIKLLNMISPSTSRLDLICLSDTDPALEAELPSGCVVHRFRASSSANPLLWGRVALLLRRIGPDVIVGWSTYANFVAALSSVVVPNARLVLSERNYLPRIFSVDRVSKIRRWIIFMLVRSLYRRADVITANSQTGIRFLRGYVGGSPDFQWLPNTVDVAGIDARADEVPVGGFPDFHSPRLLALGRLDYQKGFDVLLRAFARVRAARPDWRLAIVGDGPERRRLRSLAAGLQLDDAVEWVGATANPFPFYRWADLVLVPSRFEGFPNVPLEAMALGRAIVCSDCKTGPRELTVRGRFGRLVPVGDVTALADAVLELGDSPEKRHELGDSERAHVLRTYDMRAVRGRYLEVLGLKDESK